ncbi:hypothetical protein P154DRAFT_246791 [Amniculicola lignicola CBS 123094]|uniref:Uncharacterized protein n=1 Tax=Amniculicola lignicola CBS 123094 TaxID=1392246 RepID=A0A6A5W9R3_9PLEO|nr:hypothetical protein P154DRAFT_246791 [Amniculicola lignicola CBS 123094]
MILWFVTVASVSSPTDVSLLHHVACYDGNSKQTATGPFLSNHATVAILLLCAFALAQLLGSPRRLTV